MSVEKRIKEQIEKNPQKLAEFRARQEQATQAPNQKRVQELQQQRDQTLASERKKKELFPTYVFEEG